MRVGYGKLLFFSNKPQKLPFNYRYDLALAINKKILSDIYFTIKLQKYKFSFFKRK